LPDSQKYQTVILSSQSIQMAFRTANFTRSEMGLGTKKLLALIEDGPDAARDFETMVSPRFVPRESTGPAPSS
jgi:hypothetical protein